MQWHNDKKRYKGRYHSTVYKASVDDMSFGLIKVGGSKGSTNFECGKLSRGLLLTNDRRYIDSYRADYTGLHHQ
jgi:hypothetical protein